MHCHLARDILQKCPSLSHQRQVALKARMVQMPQQYRDNPFSAANTRGERRHQE
jgi:hypothetical protein